MERSSGGPLKESSHRSPGRLPVALLAAGIAAVVASRLSHLHLVWIEEAYGMAAAAEVLRGKSLYTGIWFDKPPLYALFYTLCGGTYGWSLRVLDIVFVLVCAFCAYLLGRRLWDRATGVLAATLLSFALTFWIPSAVMAVAPDALSIVPQLLSVWAVAAGLPLIAGVLAGVGLLCNVKVVFLLPLLVLWNWRQSGRMLAGFCAVTGAAAAVLPFREYWQQVWWWGAQYSADTFIHTPVQEFLLRTGGWIFFHATAALGTAVYLWRTRDWRMGLWIALSLAGIIAGLRFFPRYYFQLLPVVVLAGARGILMLPTRSQLALSALLLIPVGRFGPRYVQVALHGSEEWSDAALMEDSRQASKLIGSGTLFVWGYRPDMYVFSGTPAGAQFLDSQPVTGVLADRHLVSSKATFTELARENRKILAQSKPDFIVDGLGPLNPALALTEFPDLHAWLKGYEEIGRTRFSIVLRRTPDGLSPREKR